MFTFSIISTCFVSRSSLFIIFLFVFFLFFFWTMCKILSYSEWLILYSKNKNCRVNTNLVRNEILVFTLFCCCNKTNWILFLFITIRTFLRLYALQQQQQKKDDKNCIELMWINDNDKQISGFSIGNFGKIDLICARDMFFKKGTIC